MRLGIDDILSAHGVGSNSLAPYFGDGSDGAFNPAQWVGGSPTVSFGDGYIYETSGSDTNPITQTSGLLQIGVVLAGQSGNVTAMPAQASSFSQGTNWSTGSTFVPNSTVEAVRITVGVSSAVSGVNMTLWNYNSGAQLAKVSNISLAAGTNTINLPSTIVLTSGTKYKVSFYSANAITFYTANAATITASNAYVPNTITFTSTQDGSPVIKNFTSINIPQYVTVTVSNRCKGLIMFCQGDVTINGTISMDYMGAILNPTDSANGGGYVSAEKVQKLYYPLGNNKFVVIGPGGQGGDGGAGGVAEATFVSGTVNNNIQPSAVGGEGTSGTWWGGGLGGGGAGGGGAWTAAQTGDGYQIGGNGGNAGYPPSITSAAGGAASATNAQAQSKAIGTSGNAGGGAGGVGVVYNTYSSSAMTSTGGSGGVGQGGGGGGGGGAASLAYGGAAGSTTGGSGGSPTGGPGGLILIIAGGNVTIGSTGKLSANGAAGGAGGSGSYSPYGGIVAVGGGGGGGGAGGGIISILYKGTYSNSGSTSVSGGAGGNGGSGYSAVGSGSQNGDLGYAQNGMSGKSGGNGVLQVVQLAS